MHIQQSHIGQTFNQLIIQGIGISEYIPVNIYFSYLQKSSFAANIDGKEEGYH